MAFGDSIVGVASGEQAPDTVRQAKPGEMESDVDPREHLNEKYGLDSRVARDVS